jgi:hypothetical protein
VSTGKDVEQVVFGKDGLLSGAKKPKMLVDCSSISVEESAAIRERLIGSIRRECVDHFIVLGEAHLRRILRAYAGYYNGVRTHRSLDKDAPVSRPVQRTGVISSRPILGGLHHHYVQI